MRCPLYILVLRMIQFCSCSAEQRHYFVKYNQNDTTQLHNIHPRACYVWTVSAHHVLDTCVPETCPSNHVFNTCIPDTCPLQSKAVDTPSGLQEVIEINVEVTLRVKRCTVQNSRCRERLSLWVSAFDSQGVSRRSNIKFPLIEEVESFDPKKNITSLLKSNIAKGMNLTKIQVEIEPYTFCGSISEVLVYTTVCLAKVVLHDLVVYPYSVTEGRVNGECIANAVRKSPLGKLYAMCDFKQGYTQFSGEVCECKPGFTKIDGACLG